MPTIPQTEVCSTRTQTQDRAFWITYLLAAVVVLISYSSLFRPLWTDEAIHFVLSGQPSLSDLLLRLHNPDPGFLTRQTGFYQVLNYLTLQATGANWVALRLPSIVSGILMIWAMYVFLRERGLPRSWQFLGLGFLAGQSGLMYFVGEARPYLPYAATTLGMLAYFTAGESARAKKSTTALGCLALYLGALFHPYFLLILPMVLMYAVWYRFYARKQRFSWTNLLKALHPRLVGGALLLAIILGWLTWMRPQETNQLDPFAWTGGSLFRLSDIVLNFHLEFLSASALRSSFLASEVILFIFLFITRRYRQQRDLFASTLLILLAFMTSLVISLTSVANSYAIANRQLVVGPLLIAVACVWQLFVVSRQFSDLELSPKDLYVGGAIGLVVGALLLEFNGNFPRIPLTLLILLTFTGAAITCRKTFFESSTWRSRIAIALLISGGVIVSSLSVTTRIPPRWHILVALTVGVLLLMLLRFWPRAGRPFAMSGIFTTVVVTCAAIASVTILIARVSVVKSEYDARAILESRIELLGSDGVSLLENAPITQLQKETEYGPAWVYLSNINALRGGSVWAVLGAL